MSEPFDVIPFDVSGTLVVFYANIVDFKPT